MSIFYSCKDAEGIGESATQSTVAEKKELLAIGNNILLEINSLEKDLKHLTFTKEITVLNGVVENQIILTPLINSAPEAYESKDSLIIYIGKLEQFLKDYPADQYSLTSRSELNTKLDLAKKMLAKIEDYLTAN
jgi:hypothetical protein